MALLRHIQKSIREDKFLTFANRKSSIARCSGGVAGNINADFGVARPNGHQNSFSRQYPKGHRHQFSSTTASPNQPPRMNPIYQIYGETCAFTVKAILPEFRAMGSTIVLDARKRGRILLEWSPRDLDGKHPEIVAGAQLQSKFVASSCQSLIS